MIICAKAKRKKDGTIDIGEMADIRAIPEQNIAEIVRENGGKVLVRTNDGEPAEYYDAVEIDGESILSGEMKQAMEEGQKPKAKSLKLKA